MFHIFDLDGTLINSSHRSVTDSGGNLNLAQWIENSTPEKVAKDGLLPMVGIIRKVNMLRNDIILLTARVMGPPDFIFLVDNSIPHHKVISRPNGCKMKDAELKDIQLRMYAQSRGISWVQFCQRAIVYDDNQSVLKRLSSIGLNTVDSVKINAKLQRMVS